MLEPVDLVYICGNKFLATNATRSPVHVTYRVVGTDETGSLTLREGRDEDQGFSETELETKGRGVVELYQDGERVARRRTEGSSCGASPISASVAGVASPAAGSWTAPFTWPNVAIHLSLLPDGRVLSWGEFKTPQIWDPATGVFTSVPSPLNLFCAGHSFLADGRLLVSGGHLGRDRGFPDNTIFSVTSESWTRSTPMRRGRWYPTNTTLGNGDVVILAGRDQVSERVLEPEVWSPNGVRVLGTAAKAFPYYPRAFLAPNGKLFYAGEQRPSRYLDPSGTGKWERDLAQVLYGNREYGSAVMYDEGRILYVGGGRTTNTAEIIDLNSAPAWQWTGSMAFARRHLNATVLPTGEVLVTGGTSGPGFNDIATAVHAAELWSPVTGTWTTLASNAVDRGYHSTSILLPDGRVLHAGSGDGGGQEGIENAEIFSPPYLFKGSRPTITEAPSAVAYGTSFSVATPEAEIITNVSLIRLGSTTHAFDMNQRFQWLSFARETGALTVSAPTSRNIAPPGHYILFILDENGVPSVGTIVRLGSGAEPPPPPPPPQPSSITLTTSGRTDETKQYMTLDWTGAAGANVDVYRNGPFLMATPNDGHYVNSRPLPGLPSYTYKVCQTGTTTCSNESTLQFGGGPPPNTPPVASFRSSCSGLTCDFTDQSTDADGSVATWAWSFGDGAASSAQSPSHTYGAAGTYTVTLTVTDNGGATSQVSSEVTAVGTPATIVLTVTGRKDATKQYMTLRWTGGMGPNVDIYRNGAFLTATLNDGYYVNTRSLPGSPSYTYKVCQTGTSICSNEATVVFS